MPSPLRVNIPSPLGVNIPSPLRVNIPSPLRVNMPSPLGLIYLSPLPSGKPQVFGVSLEKLAVGNTHTVPFIVRKIVEHIEENGGCMVVVGCWVW